MMELKNIRSMTPQTEKDFLFLGESAKEMIEQKIAEEEQIIKIMLRHQVEPPIRGEITPGKIRWRGLFLARDIEGNLLGLVQRGRLIKPDVAYIKALLRRQELLYRAQKAWSFGMKKQAKDRQANLEFFTGGILEQCTDKNKDEL